MRALTLLLCVLLLTTCAEKRVPVSLSFDAVLDGHSINCTASEVSLSDLRFFVSDLALIDDDGRYHEVALHADDRWQSSEVALLDLENGQGHCRNGTAETNKRVSGTAADVAYVGIRFVVGVPFGLNHGNPLLAEPPLNVAAMHWHWRSGYKFMRIGVGTQNDGFWIHLGSTGCQGTVQDITGCSAPNRVTVVLPLTTGTDIEVLVDLSALLESTDLSDQQLSDCSSGPAESACGPAFLALGLDATENADVQQQRLFTVRP